MSKLCLALCALARHFGVDRTLNKSVACRWRGRETVANNESRICSVPVLKTGQGAWPCWRDLRVDKGSVERKPDLASGFFVFGCRPETESPPGEPHAVAAPAHVLSPGPLPAPTLSFLRPRLLALKSSSLSPQSCFTPSAGSRSCSRRIHSFLFLSPLHACRSFSLRSSISPHSFQGHTQTTLLTNSNTRAPQGRGRKGILSFYHRSASHLDSQS